jgi:hypothetical protein
MPTISEFIERWSPASVEACVRNGGEEARRAVDDGWRGKINEQAMMAQLITWRNNSKFGSGLYLLQF